MGFWDWLDAVIETIDNPPLRSASDHQLWVLERRWHFQACDAIREGDKHREQYCLEQMAACQAELDRRGVTHL